MMKFSSKNTTSWSPVAEWYDGLLEGDADSFQAKVILPGLLRIVDPKPDMSVLDIACGQGYFSRAFAAAGAKTVGCDISAELIARAKSRGSKIERSDEAKTGAGGEGVEFRVAPADNLSFLKDGSVDVATVVLALQNIENLSGAVAEAARVLKSGGRFIFVLNHPAFRIPKRSGWEWDQETGNTEKSGGSDFVQFRRIDGYMSDSRAEIDMTPGEKDQNKKISTVSFHRPLQSYFKALNKSGLSVTRLEEWISHKRSEPGPRAAEEDRMRKEIPMFMCVEAQKL